MRDRTRPLDRGDMELMRVPKRFWRVTLDQIQEGRHRAVILRYAAQLDQMVREGAGLLLWGDNGVGKTGASVAIAKEARRFGYTVLFIRAADLRNAIFRREYFNEQGTLIEERAREVDLLVLDDAGKEGSDEKGSSERALEDVLRARTSEMRSTLITTNLSVSAFADPGAGGYRRSFVAALIGAVHPVQVEGVDRRQLDASKLADQLDPSSPTTVEPRLSVVHTDHRK